MITWQSKRPKLDDIIAGRHDTYIKTWATGLRDLRGEVYLRIFPEMNGDWVSWHGNPEKLKRAWVHIVTLFQAEGASNVKWVWAPNITDWPRTLENRLENYYPGDAYVDIIGLDGYNWGTVRDWSSWTQFEDLFARPYLRVTALSDSRPVWITEIASAERGGDKGEWIDAMLSSNAFPRIEAVVWFNERKEADWRIESSRGSRAAFRNWFSLNAELP